MLGIRSWGAVALGVLSLASRQSAGVAELTASEILDRALGLSEQVNDYTATVSMRSDIQGGPPEVPAFKVYFKRPDKIHVESRSIVAVRKDMLSFGDLSQRARERADVLLLGHKEVDGAIMYTLKLVPKDAPQAVAERVLLHINGSRWTVSSMEITDGRKTRVTMDWDYVLVGEKYWMPSRIRCTIPEAPSRDGERGAWLEISFADYTVNTGLSDSIFEHESD